MQNNDDFGANLNKITITLRKNKSSILSYYHMCVCVCACARARFSNMFILQGPCSEFPTKTLKHFSLVV